MELQHRFSVPASVDTTWAMFNDLESVTPCFPGATLTSVSGDEFAGTVKVKLGPVSLLYSGTGTFLERDVATHTARFEAKGKDKRGNGTASAKVRAVLTPDGTGTAVEVSTELAVTGKPAQFGRGLMQDVSDKLLARFVDCLTSELTSGPAASAAESEVTQVRLEPVDGAGAGEKAQPQAAFDPAEPAAGPGTGAPAARTAPAAEELDLGSTVLPVLARRYGPQALGVLVFLLVVRRLLRR